MGWKLCFPSFEGKGGFVGWPRGQPDFSLGYHGDPHLTPLSPQSCQLPNPLALICEKEADPWLLDHAAASFPAEQRMYVSIPHLPKSSALLEINLMLPQGGNRPALCVYVCWGGCFAGARRGSGPADDNILPFPAPYQLLGDWWGLEKTIW